MRVLVAEVWAKAAAHLRRGSALPWLAAGIALAGVLLFSLPWRWLETAENLTVDLRYRARGVDRTEPQSMVVGIADSSFTIAARAPDVASREPALAAMAASWPWDRRVFAALVRRLRASGARAIVFDLVFEAGSVGDAEFARALAEPGAPVVLAGLIQQADSATGEATVTVAEPQAALLAANGGHTGYANVWLDPAGVLRRLTTAVRPAELLGGDPPAASGGSVPSLALAAVQALSPSTAAAKPSGFIDYRGPAGVIPTLPIEDVFLPDRWNGSWLQSGRLFRDRVVWVGPLSEIRFKDYHATPFERTPGVEVQAQIFETLVRQRVLQPLPYGMVIALVALHAALAALATSVCRRVPLQLFIVVGGVVGWTALAFGLFAQARIVLPVVAPMGGWLLAGSGGLATRFLAEQRDRRRLRAVLDRYVSEQVAQIILQQPDEFSEALRGQRRPVAVLFADLRGFTGWMERAEPEAVVAQLNEYFHAVVDCVLAQGGTLQKFIGDAVLAVWGDTQTAGAAADAVRAVNAALAMEATVTRLNATWRGRGDRASLAIGIGLHHGMAMVGNVGHPRRMEFTVLGDAVNVAARLESANRQLGTTVLASAAIRDLTAATHVHAPLGRFVLKGRSEAVEIFVPFGLKAESVAAWLPGLEHAQAAWCAGDFSGAANGYAALGGQPSPLADFFNTRANLARQYAAVPPAGWRGTHVLELK